jgi:hypothetical protein
VTSLLEQIYNIKNENLKNQFALTPFKFRLKQYDLKNLRQAYEEIICQMMAYEEDPIVYRKIKEQSDILIKENKKSKLVELFRSGIPNSLRRKIYLYLMGVDPNSVDDIKINDENVYLIDYLMIEDIKISVSNENYFLFEDNLKKVLLHILRDKNVLSEIQGIRPILIHSNQKYVLNQNMNNFINTNSPITTACPYPSSGIIPMKGLAYLCAPFCYTSNNVAEILLVFKSFFCKYLSFLSSFTSNKNSILSLIFNFHHIFSSFNEFNELYLHLQKIPFDINPTVFDWISSCFGEIISPENVFKIFDIMILTDNLSILVIGALSILFFKMKSLLGVQTKEEIKNILEMLKYESIDIMNLICNFLTLL